MSKDITTAQARAQLQYVIQCHSQRADWDTPTAWAIARINDDDMRDLAIRLEAKADIYSRTHVGHLVDAGSCPCHLPYEGPPITGYRL